MSGPRSRAWLGLAGVAVLVIGIAAGSRLGGSTGLERDGAEPRPSEAQPGAKEPPPAAATGPEETAVGGVPAGWTHDEAGARAAGVAYATANQAWLYLSDENLEASLRAIASPETADQLVADITGQVALARDALAVAAGQVWWVARPLAVRVVSHSEVRAVVAVWVVSVLSAADVAVPQSAWVTTTVELRWQGGDWRLAATSDRPGPTPVLDNSDEPWQPEALEDALAGFELLEIGR